MKLLVRPAAAADIEDAHRWYRDRGVELGIRFLAAVREAGTWILENPEAYRVFYREARRVRLRKFLYSLLYRVYPESVVVVACLHGWRDPRIWATRSDV